MRHLLLAALTALLLSLTARPAVPPLRVPEGCRPKEGTGLEPYTDTDWAKTVVHEKTGIELVFIPAGEFHMGSPPHETHRDSDEDPPHRVRITKPFYMGKFEITNEQFRRFRPDHASGRNKGLSLEDDRQPVVNVSWTDAKAFCDWAALGLPTEARWEYACRAGTTTAFHSGETITTDQVNYDGDYVYADGSKGVDRQKSLEVGSFPANAWDLHDMHGNVWEWCADWYAVDYYSYTSFEDPTGPTSGNYPILRGGSWRDPPAPLPLRQPLPSHAHRCPLRGLPRDPRRQPRRPSSRTDLPPPPRRFPRRPRRRPRTLQQYRLRQRRHPRQNRHRNGLRPRWRFPDGIDLR